MSDPGFASDDIRNATTQFARARAEEDNDETPRHLLEVRGHGARPSRPSRSFGLRSSLGCVPIRKKTLVSSQPFNTSRSSRTWNPGLR